MCCAVTETEPFVQRRTQGISGVSFAHGRLRRHPQRWRLLGPAITFLFVFEQGRKRWPVSFITFRSTPVIVVRPLSCNMAASYMQRHQLVKHVFDTLVLRCPVSFWSKRRRRFFIDVYQGSAVSLARVGVVVASGEEIRNTQKGFWQDASRGSPPCWSPELPQAQPPWVEGPEKLAIFSWLLRRSTCITGRDDGTAAVGGAFSYSCKMVATVPKEINCGRRVNWDCC